MIHPRFDTVGEPKHPVQIEPLRRYVEQKQRVRQQYLIFLVNVAADFTSVVGTGEAGTTTDVKSAATFTRKISHSSVDAYSADFTSVVDTTRLARVHNGRKVRCYIHEKTQPFFG